MEESHQEGEEHGGRREWLRAQENRGASRARRHEGQILKSEKRLRGRRKQDKRRKREPKASGFLVIHLPYVFSIYYCIKILQHPFKLVLFPFYKRGEELQVGDLP